MIRISARTNLVLRSVTRIGDLTRKLSTASKDCEKDHSDARRWLDRLNIETIPRRMGDVSFSRSSGPGGQNVNKYL